MKQLLTAQATKTEFQKSIHKWLQKTLNDNYGDKYNDIFKIEGSSIMCELPQEFFNNFDIPAGTKIEMKFVAKKS